MPLVTTALLLAFSSSASVEHHPLPVRLAPLPPDLPSRPSPAWSPAAASAGGPMATTSEADPWYLPPGQAMVWTLDPGSDLPTRSGPALDLTEDALAASMLAPAWIRRHLQLTLASVESRVQDALAALMLELDDTRAMDELAFTIATTTPEELAEMYSMASVGGLDLLVANALGPYDNEPHVPYARLVDTGEPGVDDDYRTTVIYTVEEDGVRGEWELPHPYYYWYILNPKLDMELPLYMDPERYQVAAPPAGVAWRDWLLFSARDEATFDYRVHYLQETPHSVDDGEPDQIVATGWLESFQIDPLRVVEDSSGRLTMAEVDWGAGTVLITTMDLEAAWLEGTMDLAENASLYVYRRATLGGGESVLVLSDEDVPGAGEVFQEILETEGVLVDRLPPAAVTSGQLEGYTKIMIPMAPGILGGISMISDELESWVAAGGSLFVAADPAGAGYRSASLPGGATAQGGTADGLIFDGYPILDESLLDQEIVWDGVRYDSLSGERALEEATSALDAIGWWVSQNMWDNISEYSRTHSDTERSVWPQRILHNHYGNCGELQDMATAAFRAALIPSMNVWSVEDHVWNEVYLLDAWRPFQVSWSDGPTHIDYGGVSADALFGGGKEVSAVKGFHGNGWITNEPISNYSETISLEVELTDANGDPADGAMVSVWVEAYYANAYLDIAAWTHTGPDGTATIPLGDNRNFWVMVRWDGGGEVESHPFVLEDALSGSYPTWVLSTEAGDPFITEDEAAAGSSFTFTHSFSGERAVPAPDGSSSAPTDRALDLDFTPTTEAFLQVPGEENYLGWMASMGYAYGGALIHPAETSPDLALYLVDDASLAAFEAGESFQALWSLDAAPSGFTGEVPAGSSGTVHLLAVNRSNRHGVFGTGEPDVRWGQVGDDEDPGGCACASTGGAPLRPLWALGLTSLLGLAATRRRRG